MMPRKLANRVTLSGSCESILMLGAVLTLRKAIR